MPKVRAVPDRELSPRVRRLAPPSVTRLRGWVSLAQVVGLVECQGNGVLTVHLWFLKVTLDRRESYERCFCI
jgi:hypothetical protein